MCYSAMVKRDIKYLESKYGAITIRDQIDDYLQAVAQDPKRFPPLSERIYPGHYAPVIYERDDKRVIELMRYGAYPPPFVKNPNAYTTFNARRDNLTSRFWSEAFMKCHGFAVLTGFYEWVQVKDLLQAGVVTLSQVQEEFHRQAEARKKRILAAGKKYKPTPTELKDPRLRQIIIEFRPADELDLLVPVIFSETKASVGRHDKGFAIVTDDPPAEISEAGHDRCPVVLLPGALSEWLCPQGKSAKELNELLTHKQKVRFGHRLPMAA